ncbi:MAG: hypothetical protein HC839_03040 [Leptolyngbyaceae cyanobacterium RM2_2_21]|nr:hypothetical protein [Leptolyngbyaceae cyanobacterium RM2_2_21]
MLQKTFAKLRLEHFLLGAIAIAVLIRVCYVGARELWYDEALSLLLSTGQKGSYITPPDLPVALADYARLLELPPSGLADSLFRLNPCSRALSVKSHIRRCFICLSMSGYL